MSNPQLSESRLCCALHDGCGVGLRQSVWIGHRKEFYAGNVGAGRDARRTAGLETGATLSFARLTLALDGSVAAGRGRPQDSRSGGRRYTFFRAVDANASVPWDQSPQHYQRHANHDGAGSPRDAVPDARVLVLAHQVGAVDEQQHEDDDHRQQNAVEHLG